MDDYTDIPLDLSKCIYIFTGNDMENISPILLNRLS